MDKKSLVLVSSAIKETRSVHHDNLFLGKWCLDFDEIDQYPSSYILKYHWSEYSKLESDYQIINDIYNKCLTGLKDTLNQIHQVNYSERYWRIVLGPWLGYFIQGMFDKWESLRNAFHQYQISKTIIVEFDAAAMIPNDMQSFIKLFSSNEWNHFCFAQIIQHMEAADSIEKVYMVSERTVLKSRISSFSERVKRILFSLFKNFLNVFALNNKVLLASTYLGFWNELKLNLRFKQWPFIYTFKDVDQARVDLKLRDSLKIRIAESSEFERFLTSILFKHIPTCFLEGYQSLVKQVKSSVFPHSPSIIYTANFLTYDVVAMAYTAFQVENGAKLIHGQHGGYGIPKFTFLEDHEIEISDIFLSWGWTKNKAKVIPIGMPIPVENYLGDPQKAHHLLIVRGLWPKYTFRIDSGSGLNLNDSIENCLDLTGYLNSDIRSNNLLVRLYHSDFGFKEKQRWRKRFPEVKIAEKGCDIQQLVSQSKLVIYTYNLSTGYLEYINANIPTIIFWDMTSSPVSEEAEEVFEELRLVGMFHESPETAAKHINLIWDDVNGWWNSDKVRSARRNLCLKFAKRPGNILPDIELILRQHL
jgi:putative transferase (TIGR04331 family)